MTMQQQTPFKFTFVRGGNAASVFAKDGMVVQEGLLLDGMQMAMPCVADTETRGKRLFITLDGNQYINPEIAAFMEEGYLVLEVRSPSARQIEVAIDVFASHIEAQQRYAQLQAQGRAEAYRTIPCAFCGATIDLSDLPQSEYCYCRFCSTIHHYSGQLSHADNYRICDECDMFDRNQAYTEFYFYFLLIVYGFSHSQRNMCDNCAGGLFWKTFLINFIFVLGVPSAIWVGIKSKTGRDPSLATLPSANKLALAGKTQDARQAFAALAQTLPNHPGLLTNEARGYFETQDAATAQQYLQAALAACPNYVPAQTMMRVLHG